MLQERAATSVELQAPRSLDQRTKPAAIDQVAGAAQKSRTRPTSTFVELRDSVDSGAEPACGARCSLCSQVYPRVDDVEVTFVYSNGLVLSEIIRVELQFACVC